MDDDDFAALVRSARGGDAGAVRVLIERFERDVRVMVRVRLPRSLRSQFDSMDFVQSVWKSVFTGPPSGSDACDSADRFRGYLAVVARNKVYEEYRRRTRSHKYDMNREEPLYLRRGNREVLREIEATDPTPSETVQADDQFGLFLAGLPEVEALAIRLRREGRTFVEIAERTGLSERSARRLIESLRGRLTGGPGR